MENKLAKLAGQTNAAQRQHMRLKINYTILLCVVSTFYAAFTCMLELNQAVPPGYKSLIVLWKMSQRTETMISMHFPNKRTCPSSYVQYMALHEREIEQEGY